MTLQTRKYKSKLFIETNFKRTSEPVHVLAALQHTRYIAIESAVQSLPLNAQLEKIQAIVKAHYQQQSTLPLWGEIEHYVCFYDQDVIIILSTQGEVVDTVNGYGVSRATLRI